MEGFVERYEITRFDFSTRAPHSGEIRFVYTHYPNGEIAFQRFADEF